MTDPQEISALQAAAASAFAGELPDEPWAYAVLRLSSVGVFGEATAEMQRPDGTVETIAASGEAISALLDLRKAMARDGHGAWLSATLTLTRAPDGHVDVQMAYNYDSRPVWHIEPDDQAYVKDLERYPRPRDEIPDWYPRPH